MYGKWSYKNVVKNYFGLFIFELHQNKINFVKI